MAKTGYVTYWVPQASADLKALEAQHQRTFNGNQLAIVGGMVKVAVLDGETPPKGAVTLAPKIALAANSATVADVRL